MEKLHRCYVYPFYRSMPAGKIIWQQSLLILHDVIDPNSCYKIYHMILKYLGHNVVFHFVRLYLLAFSSWTYAFLSKRFVKMVRSHLIVGSLPICVVFSKVQKFKVMTWKSNWTTLDGILVNLIFIFFWNFDNLC